MGSMDSHGSSGVTRRILLTGATGYVGGRLLRALEGAGHQVRCLARRPEFLKPKVAPTTEVVTGDVLDKRTLKDAMTGVQVAYYLIHSMGGEKNFEEEDRRAARNFGKAAPPTVVCDDAALTVFGIRPTGVREAIASALRDDGLSEKALRQEDRA
ncbi:MAG TPA: NAD(P)H-binding protein [Candidatus Methylomirabilis sp.]|nr:NAD(P)H-binding protein [Candidatus Methylomirabilis sp.]